MLSKNDCRIIKKLICSTLFETIPKQFEASIRVPGIYFNASPWQTQAKRCSTQRDLSNPFRRFQIRQTTPHLLVTSSLASWRSWRLKFHPQIAVFDEKLCFPSAKEMSKIQSIVLPKCWFALQKRPKRAKKEHKRMVLQPTNRQQTNDERCHGEVEIIQRPRLCPWPQALIAALRLKTFGLGLGRAKSGQFAQWGHDNVQQKRQKVAWHLHKLQIHWTHIDPSSISKQNQVPSISVNPLWASGPLCQPSSSSCNAPAQWEPRNEKLHFCQGWKMLSANI